jgi:hypothetical protein
MSITAYYFMSRPDLKKNPTEDTENGGGHLTFEVMLYLNKYSKYTVLLSLQAVLQHVLFVCVCTCMDG